MTMLRNALILLLAAAPVSAEGLPEFNLNSIHARDLLDRNFNPEIADGIRAYDMIPNAPEPVFVRVDGGPMPKPPAPGPEVYMIYDPNPGPSVPPPLSKAGYILMTSSTKLKMNKRKGELTVTFPDIHFAGGAFGDRSELFVKFIGGKSAPAISWAAIMCSGNSYLGYKGATVAFPSRSGSFSIKETLGLGAPKAGITRTHRWLTAGMMTLDELCSDEFEGKMSGVRAETLPKRIAGFEFEYSAREKSLRVAWKK